MATLGIDFGTSNSAAGTFINGHPQIIPMEQGQKTLPSAVFLDFEDRKTLFGTAAANAMMEGREGRFMRSLKSILGTPLAGEKRQVMNERLTLIEVIGRFLSELKSRSESATGETFESVISGRPVLFHSEDAGRNAQAEIDLQSAYELAGFQNISFMPEPEAAALAVGGTGRCLIVDIGGGTSDFTVFDVGEKGTRLLASQGIRLGGTDFDKTLNIAHAMPLFGYLSEIRNAMGPGSNPAPRSMFHDLATWEKIAFCYGPGAVREVRKWEKLAEYPKRFARLATILEDHYGHEVAYAVEAAKIVANTHPSASINLGFLERDLETLLHTPDMESALSGFAARISESAMNTIAAAKVAPESIDRIIYVGGSSLLRVVRSAVETLLPHAKPETSEVFTAVVDGLAIATKET